MSLPSKGVVFAVARLSGYTFAGGVMLFALSFHVNSGFTDFGAKWQELVVLMVSFAIAARAAIWSEKAGETA